MKKLLLDITIFFLFPFAVLNCKNMDQKNSALENQSDRLIVRVTASFAGAIGYGNVYNCNLTKEIVGNLDEKRITVTILSSDSVNLAFMSSHLNGVEFEMSCKKRKDNETYSVMAISGFVDKKRTSWDIEYLKDL